MAASMSLESLAAGNSYFAGAVQTALDGATAAVGVARARVVRRRRVPP